MTERPRWTDGQMDRKRVTAMAKRGRLGDAKVTNRTRRHNLGRCRVLFTYEDGAIHSDSKEQCASVADLFEALRHQGGAAVVELVGEERRTAGEQVSWWP